MAKKIKEKKEIEKKLIDKHNRKDVIFSDTHSIMLRLLSNDHTQQDILQIGDLIRDFKLSEYWTMLNDVTDYVIRNAIREGKANNKSSEEIIGIQLGAQMILDTISGLSKNAVVINNQLDKQREMEAMEQEEIEDQENEVPIVSKNVGV